MAKAVNIRLVKETDLFALQTIAKQTFFETFVSDETASDIRQYLNDNFSFEQLSSELQHAESQFYFAEIAHEIVGYLKINVEQRQSDTSTVELLEIERIYVLSDYQRTGIGQLFLNQAFAIAKQHGASHIDLDVWQGNHSAIGFYHKNGFTIFGQREFQVGQYLSINVLMRLVLE